MTFPTTHPALARALASRGYIVPTAVQLAVLEAGAVGRDMLVSAQTGSGKTVAFGLAMAPRLLGEAERFERANEPFALIIAPTRELAMQVERELTWLYAETGARIITCVGGMDARAEARQLSAGAHIVVGTPGRLRDHLERNRLDLSQLKAIVLDEADEMLDLGFREDLEFILDKASPERQSLLFSATMPKDIEALARRYQRDALRIETVRRDEQHADIEYQAIRVAPNDVEHAVVNVLRYHEMRATLVFCSTREAVKRLHARLVERGFSAVALSGELTQHERTTALQALRDGRARVLVATDVAARGLDLPDLALVIHADLPNDRETLLHRSGRTGRAGRKGICALIVPYNRRRKAETLVAAARLKVTWATAPTIEEIRAKDAARFVADPIFTEPAIDDDQAQVTALQSARSADEIALALIRMRRAQLPAPEDLAEDTGPPRREERGFVRREGDARERPTRDFKPRDGERSVHPMRAKAGERAPSKFDGPRQEFDKSGVKNGPASSPPFKVRDDGREMVWFRLNIGRERNADPKWLLPLICNAGGVTKADIGSIKIFDRDTRFQIVATSADQFEAAARDMRANEGQITRVRAPTIGDAPASEGAVKREPLVLPKTTETKPFSPRKHAGSGHGKPAWKKRDGKDYRPAAGHTPAGSTASGKKPHRKGDASGPKPVSKYQEKKKTRGETLE